MPTNQQYLELYGRIRKDLLSRYFALGRYFRNDFFQESTNVRGFQDVEHERQHKSDAESEFDKRRQSILQAARNDPTATLWKKENADRDNPWLYGCKLTIALATEARLGMPAAETLLDRTIRSCEQLFSTRPGFGGYPVRFDPITSDDWMPVPGSAAGTSPEQGICKRFLITPDGKDYIFSTPPNDPRHFPYLSESTGRTLMGRRLFTTYKKRRNNYVEQYRQWEASQDEMTGVITTYVAVAEGTQNDALRRIARARLRKVLTYLSDSAYLMVLPRGGVAARGPGDALPALEWPFANAIARAVGDAEPSWSAVSFEGGLQRAGLWKLFEGPTDRAMALAWTTAVVLPDPLPNPAGAGPLVREVAAALAAWSTTSWTPKFLTPGHVGFVAGIYLARDGFDCGNTNNDDASSGMAIAALMHSWPPETRFRNYIDYVANYTGDWSPFSTGFVPFLGFLAAGGTDSTTRVAYDFWLRKRRQRGVDTDPVIGWSSTCFASAVALLVNQGADPAEEQKFIELLDTQYERVSYWPGRSSGEELPILEYHDTWAALDYLSSLALAWRYRRDRESAGGTLPIEFPSPPPSDVIWPEPAVPRSAIESPDLNGYIPIAAIQGIVPPAYDGQEARLFAASSPTRPPAPRPNLTFGDEEFTSTETFQVGPGPEVFTGVALQWGDVWEITATGEVTIGGTTFAPEGGSEPVYDARYPVHFGRDSGATNGCLVARLNNYVVIKKRRRPERWLFPEETFIYLSLNQSTGVLTNGTGTFEVTVTLRGPKRDLSTVREISCVTRDKSDPDRRIDGVGGVGRSGLRWWLSLEDARLQIEQGVRFIVRQKDVRPALVDIRKRQGTLYLATQPDPPPARRRVPLPVELRNNLSWKAMPECPFNG